MSEQYSNVRRVKEIFCPDCHNLLYPKKIGDRVLHSCISCGEVYEVEKDATITRILTQYKKDVKKEIRIIEGDEAITASKVPFDCPKCKNKEAYSWLQQFGAADEPPHEFRRCTKCGHTEKSGWQI